LSFTIFVASANLILNGSVFLKILSKSYKALTQKKRDKIATEAFPADS